MVTRAGGFGLRTAATVSTQDESRYESDGPARAIPGALIVFSHNAPMLRPVPVANGPVMLGRDGPDGQHWLPDSQLSGQHLEVGHDAQGFTLRSVGKNGTHVNRARMEGTQRVPSNAVVRVGRTVLLLCDDVAPFLTGGIDTPDGLVVGPRLKRVHDAITAAARPGPVSVRTTLVTGETGSGKELAATTFHRAAAPKGPMVRFNCSNLSSTLADSQLFGHVKGAFSEAKADKRGLLDEADGGVLFLDEVADLNLEVQAKLLRAVETGEFFPLGGTTVRKVDVRYLSATHKDLEAAKRSGAFREDLYFRLAQAHAQMPPLRERREEIPWLIAHALAEAPVRTPHAFLIEYALLQQWPGNARELLAEVRAAARTAKEKGSDVVRDEHLPSFVGPKTSTESRTGSMAAPRPITSPLPMPAPIAPAPPAAPTAPTYGPDMTREEVVAMMNRFGGNASRAARETGMHRETLNRLRDKYGLRTKKDDEG
jgi:DNA-binding NtrC family response regulator